MEYVDIGGLKVSRFIIGGNPFSGFSHQGTERDREMRHYYTTARIKEALQQAEQLGINAHVGRADHHVIRVLLEYWDEGGAIQWFAQTCPELGPPENGIKNAINGGARACYIHGGVMDRWLTQDRLNDAPAAIEMIKDAGLVAGIAGHTPAVFEWAEKHLDVDFYMCSYYSPVPRDKNAEHVAGLNERYVDADRQAMTRLIQTLSKPVIHYKVLAAGRNSPEDAFAYVVRHLRPQDAVAAGVFTKEDPAMLENDVKLLEEGLRAAATQRQESTPAAVP